jgi:hypothetical protein
LTALKYSDDHYQVYFEVADLSAAEAARTIGTYTTADVRRCANGVHTTMPLQTVPEAVRALAHKNIAIYQVVRGTRITADGRVLPK